MSDDKLFDTKVQFVLDKDQFQKMLFFYLRASGQRVPDPDDIKIEFDLGDKITEFDSKSYSYNSSNDDHKLVVSFDVADIKKAEERKANGTVVNDEAWTSEPLICGKNSCPAGKEPTTA